VRQRESEREAERCETEIVACAREKDKAREEMPERQNEKESVSLKEMER
jgi:hypothetical protein